MGNFATLYSLSQVTGSQFATPEEIAWASQFLNHKARHGRYDLRGRLLSGRTLFVGEGNLSFSLAIARLNPLAARNFVSSTFEGKRALSDTAARNAFHLSQLRATVLHGVDATALERFFGRTRFDNIVFNFPNVASRTPIYGHNPNHHMIRRFFCVALAGSYLAAEKLSSTRSIVPSTAAHLTLFPPQSLRG